MPTVPTDIPSKLRIGDTWNWTKTLTDYPAGGIWAFTYYLINSASKIELVASADGENWQILIDAVTTAGYTAGRYQWYNTVESDKDQPTETRHTLETGEIELLPDIEALATLDTRTEAEKNLERIDLLLTGNTNASYSIGTPDGGNRSLTRHDITALELLRRYWAGRRTIEIRRERAAKGLGHSGNIKVWLP